MDRLRSRLDKWVAAGDDRSLCTRRRLDRHVLGGAKIFAWLLATSLLGLHLPTVFVAFDTVSVEQALVVALGGSISLAALWIFGSGRRTSDGENLSSVWRRSWSRAPATAT